MAASSPSKTALVTGANGFIGHAVAKAFVAAGYTTYGLVRRPDALSCLSADEIIPILGTPDDHSFIPTLHNYTKTLNVIASATEDLLNYTPHFNNILSLLISLSRTSSSHGIRSLVLFSSGCKDYGIGPLHSSSVLPFTEASPLNPQHILIPRATLSQTILHHSDVFDAVVLRPTTLFGGSSSYYGPAFELAATTAASATGVLRIAADPNSIMHGTHVGDVAEAYVALAEAPRERVAGHCYNISSQQYETTQTIANALAKEYGLKRVEFVSAPPAQPDKKGFDVVGLLFGFSQWVGSEKIRRDIGWTDRRPTFSKGLHVYRRAYEEAAKSKHSNVERVKGYIALWDE